MVSVKLYQFLAFFLKQNNKSSRTSTVCSFLATGNQTCDPVLETTAAFASKWHTYRSETTQRWLVFFQLLPFANHKMPQKHGTSANYQASHVEVAGEIPEPFKSPALLWRGGGWPWEASTICQFLVINWGVYHGVMWWLKSWFETKSTCNVSVSVKRVSKNLFGFVGFVIWPAPHLSFIFDIAQAASPKPGMGLHHFRRIWRIAPSDHEVPALPISLTPSKRA